MTSSRAFVSSTVSMLLIVFVTFGACGTRQSGSEPLPAFEGGGASPSESVRLGALPSDAAIIFASMRWKQNRKKFGQWELYVMNRDGGNVERMTFGGRNYNHAAVSPDWQFIAAVTKEEGDAQALWIYDLKKQTETRLVPDFRVAGAGGVDWSRDGFIYFAGRADKKGQGDVYTILPDGTKLTNVTNTPEGEMDVSVSEDGQFVAFVRLVRSGRKLKTQIWRMNSNGTDQRMVYDGGSDWGSQGKWPLGGYDPEFSPDNSKVIFSRTNTNYDNFRQGAHDICISNADGTGFEVLTRTPGPIQMIPDWKDDLILYTEFNEKEQYVGMVTISPAGTNRKRLEGPFEEIWDGGRHGKFVPDRDSAWPYGAPDSPRHTSAADSFEELVRNGDMEERSSAWQLAPGVKESDSRFWSGDHARNGYLGKRIRSTGRRSVYDFQYLEDPRLPGARVTFSAWIRANEAASRVTARLRWGGPDTGFVDLVEDPLEDRDWHHFSKTVHIPTSATEIAVACWAAGHADGAFDDVSVKIDVRGEGAR